ncbi:MAG TPA: acyltransferase [Acidimicrobiales bacterium]|nr:acyltransferase [Acidimicrobiales bacterium]
MAKGGRFPCFDGLRALAAVSVVVVHTAFSSGFSFRSAYGSYTARAEIGVSVFFLISGFLLYRPMASAHLAGRPSPSPRRFLARRALRIVPAYWLALTVLAFGLHWLSLGRPVDALQYYGFAQIYSRTHVLGGISQAWSLCTEVSFYLFLPLYGALLACGRRDRTARRQLGLELAGLAALIGTSAGFRAWIFIGRPRLADQMAVWLPSYLDLFALGMALAVMSAWWTEHAEEPDVLRHKAQPAVAWVLAAALYWLVSHAGLPITPLYRATYAQSIVRQELYGLFALCLLAPAVFGPQDQGLVRGLLRWRPVAAVGVVSYGVYLWHQAFVSALLGWAHRPIFGLPMHFLLPATLGLASAAAAVSYLLVERLFLRLKPRRARLDLAPAEGVDADGAMGDGVEAELVPALVSS